MIASQIGATPDVMPLIYGDGVHDFDSTVTATLNSQDAFLTYPSPISPPAEFCHEQFSDQAHVPMTSNVTSAMLLNTSNEEETTVSVSTSFHPGAHAVEPDMVFTSSDMVLFYVHSQVLEGVSPNAFRQVIKAHQHQDKNEDAKLGSGPNNLKMEEIIPIPDTSVVLNVILHMLYGTSAAQNSPTFEVLTTAVYRMPFYDINPRDHITPRTSLYQLLLNHAPLFPLELYALAAHHDLEDLAVATSSHLLSYPLANLSDEMAQRMGAVYLKRLLTLHLDRFNALKHILLAPPHPHPATKECSFSDQRKLTRAWALVAAYLAWDARPDLSTHSMRNAFQPLTENLACELCRSGLQARIKDIIVQWASVRRTI